MSKKYYYYTFIPVFPPITAGVCCSYGDFSPDTVELWLCVEKGYFHPYITSFKQVTAQQYNDLSRDFTILKGPDIK